MLGVRRMAWPFTSLVVWVGESPFRKLLVVCLWTFKVVTTRQLWVSGLLESRFIALDSLELWMRFLMWFETAQNRDSRPFIRAGCNDLNGGQRGN